MDVIEHTRRSGGSAPEPGTDRSLRQRLERWAAQPAFATGILALTLLLTGLAWWAARIDAQDEARVRFEHQTEDLEHRLAQGMTRYELLLRSGVALFASTEGRVTRHAWRKFHERLDLDRLEPGLQGLGVAQWLRPEELPAHEQAIRAEGHPDYRVHPAGPRDAYSSIIYLEPFSGRNLRAFGYDMHAEPTRRAAMDAARDSGDIRLSGTVTLVQEDGKDVQKGLLMYAPVYRGGRVPEDTAQRQALLWGWVYAPFRMNDLMQGVLGTHTRGLSIALYDGEEAAPAHLAYQSPDLAKKTPSSTRQTQTRALVLGGRPWTMKITGEELPSDGAQLRTSLVALCGLVLNALLFWMVAGLAQRRRRSEHEVAARTEELQSRTAWLDAVSGLSPNGLLVFEREPGQALRLVFTNPAFSRLFGLRPEDLLGLTEEAVDEWLSGLDDPRYPHQALGPGEAQVALAGPPPQILQRRCREEGLQRVYYFQDVTRESEIERMKNEFLTTAAHELRTPLASVFGFSELLMNPSLPAEKRTRIVAIVHRQAGVLRHLVDDLLDLARLDARGKLDLVRSSADLRDVACLAVESFSRPGATPRIQVRAPDAALPVRIDATKVQQAIANALSNGLKYSREDQPVRLTLDFASRAGQACAQVRVEDEGIGMSAEECARAFERFYRADPTGHIAGAGLGLAIVQEVMALHGGEVELRSHPGAGTTLTLYVPLATAAAPTASTPADAAALTS